jgi:hypothetical protein
MGRRLSTVHSRQRRISHRRTGELPKLGWVGWFSTKIEYAPDLSPRLYAARFSRHAQYS